MAVKATKAKDGRVTSHRVVWRLNGARDGAWQSVKFGRTTGHAKQARALDGWLRDVHGYALADDDPRIDTWLGREAKPEPDEDDEPAPTVGALMADWIASKPRARSSVRGYTAAAARLTTLADVPVDRLTADNVDRAFRALSAKYAPKTVHTSKVVLKAATAAHVMPSVFASINGMGQPKRRVKVRVLSDEQIESLLDTARRTAPEMVLPVLLTAELGLRWGEMAGITIGDIDLNAKPHPVLHLAQAVKQDSKRTDGFRGEDLKTERSRRTVPLSARLADALALVAHPLADPDAPVLAPPYADSWLYDGFRNAWSRLKAATPGVSNATRFHDLRHSAATRLVARQVDVGTVADVLGQHVRVTMDEYAHADPRRTAAILSAGLSV